MYVALTRDPGVWKIVIVTQRCLYYVGCNGAIMLGLVELKLAVFRMT